MRLLVPLPYSQVAVAVFAIPTGIFGAGFEDMIQHRKQGKQQQEDEQAAAGDGSGSSAGGYFTLSPTTAPAGPDGGNSVDVSDHAYGGGGPAVGVDANQVDGFEFLDTRTRAGKRYRTFVLAVVVLDILAFFASTTFYLQVRRGRRNQQAQDHCCLIAETRWCLLFCGFSFSSVSFTHWTWTTVVGEESRECLCPTVGFGWCPRWLLLCVGLAWLTAFVCFYVAD